jgi:hypothetical protein
VSTNKYNDSHGAQTSSQFLLPLLLLLLLLPLPPLLLLLRAKERHILAAQLGGGISRQL